MNQWPQVTLTDVSTKPQYGAIAKGSAESIGPPFVRQTDIASGRIDWSSVPFCDLAVSEFDKYALHPGDLLISRLGNGVGNAATVRESRDAVFAGYLVRFKAHAAAAIPEFLGYQLQSNAWRQHVAGFRSGAAQPTLNAQQMGAFRFNLPPIREQRGIAATLGALDDKIESNSRQLHLLDEVMSARFLHLAARDNLSSLLFDDVVERLAVKHKHSAKTVTESGRTPVLDQSDAGLLGFHDGSAEFITDASNPISLFGDHTCTWRLGIGAFDVGPNVIPATTKSSSGVHPIWMHFALRGAQAFQEYRRHWMEFRIHQIPWVSAASQQAFVDEAIPMLAHTSHLEDENRLLADLRDQLLPELLSGRRRVPDAGEVVEEVVVG